MTPGEPAAIPTVSVTVNGETREWPAGTTVAQVVADAVGGEPAGGIAVAVNDQVVRRADWAATLVGDHDRCEILTAVQGG